MIKKLLFIPLLLILSSNSMAQEGLGSLISPGELASPHAKYEGIRNCTECHSLGGGIPDGKCLDCHTKLAANIKNKKGSHFTYTDACIKCHKDHKGTGYKMVILDKSSYNHDVTGYTLEDRHRIDCIKCHKKEDRYTGLSRECISCHKDVHNGQFEKYCEKCHNIKDWKDIKKFDHDKASKYPLTGKHIDIKCIKCHEKHSYKVERFEECITCHRDPHKGKPLCKDCHSTEGWKKVKTDHSKTRYPLEDKHVQVPCDKCHKNSQLKGVPFATCDSSACHSNPHKQQFKDKKCESCHNIKGWAPSLFKHEDPEYRGYKLEGKHADTKCEKCHAKDRYKPLNYKTCDTVDCHKDTHKGQFKGRGCDSCHNMKGWKPSLFKHEHEQPEYKGYKLEGKHIDTKCEKCHIQDRYKPLNYKLCDSADCHKDVHKGQFVGKFCESCHNVNGWKPSLFRHESPEYKGYKLDGRHVNTKCEKCHEGGKYRPLSSKCLDCHRKDDVHKNELGSACEKCHDAKDWKKFTLNHNTQTKFPLIGKHVDAKCEKCHKDKKYKSKAEKCVDCHKDVHKGEFKEECSFCHTQYDWHPRKFDHKKNAGLELRGVHNDILCVSCHKTKGEYRKVNHLCNQCHVDPHLNQFGSLNCSDCHGENSWNPTRFDHSRTGFPLVGKHRQSQCGECHKSRVYRNTSNACIGCHAGQYSAAPKHLAKKYGSDCVTCHPATETAVVWSFHHENVAGGSACANCHMSDYPASHTVNNYGTSCVNCHKYPTWSSNMAHTAVTSGCSSCHLSKRPATHTANPAKYPATCETCHNSTTIWTSHVHPSGASGCSTCHLSQRPATHTSNTTKYSTTCENCHKSTATWASHLHPTVTSGCSTCHTTQKPAGHTSNGYSDICENCHKSTASWTATGHPAVTSGCSSCHLSKRPATHTANPAKYPAACETCHNSTITWTSHVHPTVTSGCSTCHTAQKPASHPARGYSETCENCHKSTALWTFSHPSAATGCSTCHLTYSNPAKPASHLTNGWTVCENCHKSFTVWVFAHSTAKVVCYTCHAGKAPPAHNTYSIRFGNSCENCHTYPTWPTNTFSHTFSTFPVPHKTGNTCLKCHSSQDYGNKGGCTGCHGNKHNKGYTNTQCLGCHPFGLK